MTRFEALDPEIRGVLGKKVMSRRVEGSPVEGRSAAIQRARSTRSEEVSPGLLSDGRVGMPGSAAGARHPVLPGRSEAADDREGGSCARDRSPDHDVHASRGGARLQLRLSPVYHAEWRDLFGPFFRSYRDEYWPIPFSKHFKGHIEGWYAQKHPTRTLPRRLPSG